MSFFRRGGPTDREIVARYARLSQEEQGFVQALNEIAQGKSVEQLLKEKRAEFRGDLQTYQAWLNRLNLFAHQWACRC